MPEGDTLQRTALRLQAVVGGPVVASAPNPRARAEGIAAHLDGRTLESVEAIGKNLLFRFSGGVVLRSHLRLSGRWAVGPPGRIRSGRPWLVLRGERAEAVLWNGPVLELHARALERLGPDILERPPRLDAMLARMRRADQTRFLGETLLDQSLVAGIGNVWLAEALWEARLSPWLRLRDVGEDDRRRALAAAAALMREAVDRGRRGPRRVHGRAGRPCPRCRTAIRSHGQGEGNRTAFWCPRCQEGMAPGGA